MPFFSWSFILFYGISASCGLLVLRTLRSPQPRPQGWLIVPTAVMVLTWMVNLISMQWAVLVGGIAWLLFILLPSIGLRQTQALIYRQRYEEAYYWTLILRYFHPFDGWWEQPDIMQALCFNQQGKTEQGRALLEKRANRSSLISQQAIAMNYAMQFDWAGLLAWYDTATLPKSDPLLTMYYCRALGETGQLHALLLSLESCKTVLLRGGDRRNFNLVQLFVAAFCGEVKLVQQLTASSLSVYAKEIQDFWLAIAYYAAGEKNQGDKQLQTLSQYPEQNFQLAIKARLQNQPAIAKNLLYPESYPLIAKLSRDIQQENIEYAYSSLIDRRPNLQKGFSVNTALISVNSVVFCVGIILGFKVERDALIRWGGFVPDLVWTGEWWRVITATFIHAGWAHLIMNMVTLMLLGAFAEKHLGRWRYLAIYLCSGVAAMLTLLGLVALAQGFDYASFPPLLFHLTAEIRYSYQLWVGASGAIMGVIGAIAVILYQGWRRIHSQLALKQLRLIAFITVFQFAIDLTSANVSFYSHFLGLLWGILFTILLTRRTFKSS